MNIGQLIAERGKPFYSFEFFPPKDPDQWPDFFKMAERLAPLEPLFTSVTYGAGGSSQDATLEIVSHLKKEFQFETMAHLTCVGATQDYITQYLQRLRDNGVDNVLALRGDIPKEQDIDWETAEFRHAADLVRFAKAHYPDMGIGVAGYPAPHPESPSFASDWRYTVAKIREGADFVITQLFFDVRIPPFCGPAQRHGRVRPGHPRHPAHPEPRIHPAHALPVRREHPGQALSRP